MSILNKTSELSIEFTYLVSLCSYLYKLEAFHYSEILHFLILVFIIKYKIVLKFSEILGISIDHFIKVN